MNTSINLKDLNPQLLLRAIIRFRTLLAFVVIAGLLGYTGIQLSQINAITPDATYVTQHEKDGKTPNLKLRKETAESLQNLRDPGTTTPTVEVGKRSPFSFD